MRGREGGRVCRAGQIARAIFHSNCVSSRAISHSNSIILASILKRHVIDQCKARHTPPYHTEIDACGSYGGSADTSLLLWKGATRVGGCRCWRSMSEAVIVSIVKVLRQYPLPCCNVRREYTYTGGVLVCVAHRLMNSYHIATRRPRPGGIGPARRRIAHGYRFQLTSVLQYVDR